MIYIYLRCTVQFLEENIFFSTEIEGSYQINMWKGYSGNHFRFAGSKLESKFISEPVNCASHQGQETKF